MSTSGTAPTELAAWNCAVTAAIGMLVSGGESALERVELTVDTATTWLYPALTTGGSIDEPSTRSAAADLLAEVRDELVWSRC